MSFLLSAARSALVTFGICLAAGFSAAPCVGGDKTSSSSQERRWTSPREASDGPTLDAAWFAERKVVVYLIPPAGLPAARQAAAAVMRDRWTADDWSIKHVFVGGVPHAPMFTLGKKIGLRDAVREVTRAAGQGDEFFAENEKLVLEHVFFVHDPKLAVWKELLGDGAGRSAVVMIDHGRVVGSIDTVGLAAAPATAGPDGTETNKRAEALAVEVRKALVKPEDARRGATASTKG